MYFKDAETRVANKSVHKIVTLKKNYEFQFVFKKGVRINSNSLTLIVAPCRKKYPKFGIVVSKKIGKAVVRNKRRRQIKEIVRKLSVLPNQYVFVAKDNINEASFIELTSEVKHLLRKYLVVENELSTENDNRNC